ncbi:hypothetical protein FB567DRAFT_581210 [Paraphoma chrysanthemicola]|uniref:Uncharacterized protein n=1 Tax=Paraphoma chrysanthemicola TaxID=798071 RepID=A0A8K0R298_9PLEO|nr:hypothetical protein FB567DRAFT_581210 [Paraphoma chrysanthemicola]
MSIIGKLRFFSIEESQPQLDYALIELTDNALYEGQSCGLSVNTNSTIGFNYISELDAPDITNVTSLLGSTPGRTVGGKIDSIPSAIRLPYTKKYQEVYQADFDKELEQGDCGAWVMDTANNSLIGHIVAGSPKDGLAYVVPFNQVCAHMIRVMVTRVQDARRVSHRHHPYDHPHYNYVQRVWTSPKPEVAHVVNNPHLHDAISLLGNQSETHNSSNSYNRAQMESHSTETHVRVHPDLSTPWSLGDSNLQYLNAQQRQAHHLAVRNFEHQRHAPYDAIRYVGSLSDYEKDQWSIGRQSDNEED